MKIHEYQARQLLASYGIPVPAGELVTSIEEAQHAFRRATEGQAVPLAVVKAQVHAGGRGKAGFVKLVATALEAESASRFMLTHRMKSPQTPPEGLEVKRVLIAAGVDIAERKASGTGHSALGKTGNGATPVRPPVPSAQSPVPSAREEFYLAITTDRLTRRNVLIASREGGVEIEQVAHDRPEAIIKTFIDPLAGLHAYQARDAAFALGLTGKHASQAADIMVKLARLFVEKDCTLAEINPLVITAGPGGAPGPVMAIDAKFNFDDNALFRHKDLEAMFDPTEENPGELKARKFGLSYIALDGNIGCLVNGAGLAMSTMDIVKLHGGEPANFLDVGGSASEEAVTEAFRIILAEERCKGVLVNIFGGIMKCDIIAQGIVNAAKTVGFKVPLVVRLEGTNVEAGRQLLDGARKDIPTMQAATDLADAAQKVCAAVG